MKKIYFKLTAIFFILLFAIFAHGTGTDYVYDFQRPESFSFLVRNAWTQFIPALLIYAVAMVIIASISYSCKKSKAKKDATTIITGLVLLYSQQAIAQNTTIIETLKNNWILIFCIIGVLLVVVFFLAIASICYVVKTSNSVYD